VCRAAGTGVYHVDQPPLLGLLRGLAAAVESHEEREREMCFYVRGKDERDREHTWRIAKEERGMENIPRIGG
jgi:hypothetical protein